MCVLLIMGLPMCIEMSVCFLLALSVLFTSPSDSVCMFKCVIIPGYSSGLSLIQLGSSNEEIVKSAQHRGHRGRGASRTGSDGNKPGTSDSRHAEKNDDQGTEEVPPPVPERTVSLQKKRRKSRERSKQKLPAQPSSSSQCDDSCPESSSSAIIQQKVEEQIRILDEIIKQIEDSYDVTDTMSLSGSPRSVGEDDVFE